MLFTGIESYNFTLSNQNFVVYGYNEFKMIQEWASEVKVCMSTESVNNNSLCRKLYNKCVILWKPTNSVLLIQRFRFYSVKSKITVLQNKYGVTVLRRNENHE